MQLEKKIFQFRFSLTHDDTRCLIRNFRSGLSDTVPEQVNTGFGYGLARNRN
jgi:hypothetical protein